MPASDKEQIQMIKDWWKRYGATVVVAVLVSSGAGKLVTFVVVTTGDTTRVSVTSAIGATNEVVILVRCTTRDCTLCCTLVLTA